MKWMLSCREASKQLVRQEAEALSWWLRVQVRLHLLACRSCQRFAGQMRLMSRASSAWRRYSERDGSR